jgi:hypothetical protein
VFGDGQLAPHLHEVSAPPQADGRRDSIIDWPRLGDPHVHMTSALLRDLAERGSQKVLLKLDTRGSPLRVDDILDGPVSTISAADLRIGDDTLTAALAGDKASEALAATLDEVEPLVLAERAMTVCNARSLEQE